MERMSSPIVTSGSWMHVSASGRLPYFTQANYDPKLRPNFFVFLNPDPNLCSNDGPNDDGKDFPLYAAWSDL